MAHWTLGRRWLAVTKCESATTTAVADASLVATAINSFDFSPLPLVIHHTYCSQHFFIFDSLAPGGKLADGKIERTINLSFWR